MNPWAALFIPKRSLTICAKCEKIHFCPDIKYDNLSDWMEDVKESIVNTIPQDEMLSELFTRWHCMDVEKRVKLLEEIQIQEYHCNITMPLLGCLCYAFKEWDDVQETGATGVAKGVFCFTCDPIIQEIFNSVKNQFKELLFQIETTNLSRQSIENCWD